MGVSAKPIGKFQSIMRKIKNHNDAVLYSAKHSLDNVKKDKKTEENVEEN